MGKNWLIRTKSNHILGPVSKEKVLDLYHNASIKPDDEICSGNGYWFYVRETELVEKYLLGTTPQGFNPISEAKDVLTATSRNTDYEPTRDDITLVGGIDLKKVKEGNPPQIQAAKPAPKPEPEPVRVALETESEGSQKKKVKSESQVKNSEIRKQPKQNYLIYLGYFVLAVLVLMIYFRKSIMKSFFESEASIPSASFFMASAHAQEEDSSIKKKSF